MIFRTAGDIQEFIGQIIDVIEDVVDDRDGCLCLSDEGVYISGATYDEIADGIYQTMKLWEVC